MSTGTMFASQSIAEHVLRGVIGIGAIWLAIDLSASPWLSLGLGVVALLAFRGCPMCWTIGLVQTIQSRIAASRSI